MCAMRSLRVFSASTSAAAAAYTAYAVNERVVEQRSSQLERLRDCAEHCGGYPRTAASLSQLASYDRPIVISGLLESWPALDWTFAALRKRIGQALVDCGSSTGGVPFYLVAANSQRPAGRSDLALYVFDSDFSDEKATLLRDFADDNGDGLPALTSGDVFAAGASDGELKSDIASVLTRAILQRRALSKEEDVDNSSEDSSSTRDEWD